MISLSIKDRVAFVTLSRPEKQNALSLEMFVALDKTIKQLRRDRTLVAVVLQGSGDHFCAGLDVKSVMKRPSSIVKLLFKWLPGNANLVQRVVLGWQTLPIPVLANIKGNCLGGGCHIALGADIRIAASTAQLAIMEAKWGLCPDMGASLLLPGLVNKDNALALSIAAERIAASSAQQLGLVTEVCDDTDARIAQLLAQYRSRSPDAIAAIKQVYNRAYNQPSRKLLWQETWSQIKLLCSKNTRIAMSNATSDAAKSFRPRAKW